jgi:heptosyltransferase-1
MRVLIVKVSSLGDVLHCTPIVADILRASPAWCASCAGCRA